MAHSALCLLSCAVKRETVGAGVTLLLCLLAADAEGTHRDLCLDRHF